MKWIKNLAELDKLEIMDSLKKIYNMPEISRFYGMMIVMFYNDHEPPHFHVIYSEYMAKFDIEKGKFITGQLPNRAAKLVIKWYELHKEELLECWKEVLNHNPPNKISPLI